MLYLLGHIQYLVTRANNFTTCFRDSLDMRKPFLKHRSVLNILKCWRRLTKPAKQTCQKQTSIGFTLIQAPNQNNPTAVATAFKRHSPKLTLLKVACRSWRKWIFDAHSLIQLTPMLIGRSLLRSA